VQLTHELAHAMIANAAPRGFPVWLHEGLAQYFEGDDPQAARGRLRATGRDRIIPLKSLEGGFSRLGPAQAQVAYDESLVAVDVIMQRPAFNWSSLFRALAERVETERTFESFALSYSIQTWKPSSGGNARLRDIAQPLMFQCFPAD
jgi:hypothetical protein